MHICPQEVMALVAAAPVLQWLLALVIRWRGRRRPMTWDEKLVRIAYGEPHPGPCGCTDEDLHVPVEVIECRSCGEDIGTARWGREKLGEGY